MHWNANNRIISISSIEAFLLLLLLLLVIRSLIKCTGVRQWEWVCKDSGQRSVKKCVMFRFFYLSHSISIAYTRLSIYLLWVHDDVAVTNDACSVNKQNDLMRNNWILWSKCDGCKEKMVSIWRCSWHSKKKELYLIRCDIVQQTHMAHSFYAHATFICCIKGAWNGKKRHAIPFSFLKESKIIYWNLCLFCFKMIKESTSCKCHGRFNAKTDCVAHE